MERDDSNVGQAPRLPSVRTTWASFRAGGTRHP